MSGHCKIIHDPIHGSIEVDEPFLKILNRHEMQRLRSVKQLGLGSMVFPGANHTRFEHSLGVYHLAGRMASSVGLSDEDAMIVRAAGLLHDICHTPFSHTTEEIVENVTGMDHMEMARKLITGDMRTHCERDDDLFGGVSPISEVLEDSGIPADVVCDLIMYPKAREDIMDRFSGGGRAEHFSSKDFAHQIIHGPVDADQMDYLVRDAHYTGVIHGKVDIDRLISTMKVHNNRIMIEKGGTAAAEGLMVARSLMYSSVYYHRTVRIVKMMLMKSVEASSLDVGRIYLWDDCDLMNRLIREGGTPSKIARSVRNRILYKKVITKFTEDTSDELSSQLSEFAEYGKRKQLERDIADRAGIGMSDVVVDIPPRSVLLSNMSIGKTDVPILDPEGRVKVLTRLSPVAKALQSRGTFGWSLMIASPEEHRDAVYRASKKLLSL
ncbi:MAG: HD domain-containing protein [Candidatus Methanoplasma sp.]|jgi:HD superfamily phosphohydrolase|nr:HD domain-containing protein [Candidatus Methanoplasma sp.]